jgi:hypothetical protein
MIDRDIDIRPPARLKILFWIILGAFSVFFAEVVSGSYIFPYFTIWGILVVCPLYTLHLLVLSYIVFNYGRPSLHTLFVAGALFGMYEAYMTKVLWDPTWGDAAFSLGGIAVLETVLLVLFWHPFMAFIIPLFVGESILTGSREIINESPNRIKQIFKVKKKSYVLFVVFALLCGIFQSANSPSPKHSLLSGFSTTAVLILLIYLWRNRTKGKEYNIKALLPNKKEFRVLASLLLAQYLFLGFVLRREVLPGLLPQLIVWLMYAGLLALLVFNLRKSRAAPLSESVDLPTRFSWKILVIVFLLFPVSSAVSKILVGSSGGIIILMFWVAGGIIGTLILLSCIISLFRSVLFNEKWKRR